MSAQFKTYLNGVIGFGSVANATRVTNMGLTGFDTLPEYDKDDVNSLCRSLRKDSTSPLVIGPIVEKRLIIACALANLYTLISRGCNATTLSKARLRHYGKYMEVLEALKKNERPEPEKVGAKYPVTKFMEDLPTYLKSKIGVRGVPLIYVIRDNDTPEPLDALHTDVPYSEESGSFQKELERHLPHDGVGWEEDNAAVFDILLSALQTSSFVTSLKGYQSTQDGRQAWKNLKLHNLGKSVWDKRVKAAEVKVLHRIFDGKNHRFSLQSHCNSHREAHQEMIRASEETDYQVPDERTRVTRLLESIQTPYSLLQSAKVTVENDIQKRENFELAADFLCRFAPKRKDNPGGLYKIATTVTEMKTELDGLDNVEVDVRYYKPDEWSKLTNDQRKKCILTRQIQQRDGDTSGGKKRKFNNQQRVKKLNNKWKKKLQKQNRIIAALKAEDKPNSDENENENNKDERRSNKRFKFNSGVTQRKHTDQE